MRHMVNGLGNNIKGKRLNLKIVNALLVISYSPSLKLQKTF